MASENQENRPENQSENQFSRTQLIFGKENLEKLAKSRVIVFGIGGVGSFAAEALVRSGLGAIDIVDNDKICLSNLNRQLYALHSTLGKYKVDVAEERILDINPECKVEKHKVFFLPENADQFDFSKYDYIVDCIDTVKGKIALALCSESAGKPIISSMGAGNKVDPTKFQVADISKTSVCPLARVMRQELKKRGIKKLKCVFSTEPAIPPKYQETENPSFDFKDEISENENPSLKKNVPLSEKSVAVSKRQIPGSNAFTPSVAGLIIAGEVIKDLTDFS